MRLFSILFFSLFISSVFGQTWKYIEESNVPYLETLDREIIPSEYLTFKLDVENLKEKIQDAPALNERDGSVLINLPMPEGRFEEFEIVKASSMMDGLAAKFPQIQSYKAFSTENNSNNARITVSPLGLSAAIRTNNGDVYIDRYGLGQDEYYITYYIKNDVNGDYGSAVKCGFQDLHDQSTENDVEIQNNIAASLRDPSENIELRTYRMALSCTGAWGNRQGTPQAAMALMVELMDRGNLIFENELSINYVLIDNNDLLIHMDADTDPYTVLERGRDLIPVNTAITNNIVGQNSYDIGHVLARCSDVGGVAYRSSLCALNKAGGCTCHGGTSIGNGTIGTFAHEVGHQMSANHTMNICDMENENAPTGYEVGSGSTIMSYSGGCGIFNTGDNYNRYHVGTIQEIYNFTRNGGAGDCGVKEDIGNFSPEATADYPDGFYIPISTPFELTGDATDPDGNAMDYTWEQLDAGPLTPPGESTVGTTPPLFKTGPLTQEKNRYFPSLPLVINDIKDNKWEDLPTYSRDLNFRFVVRDNNPGGGTIDWAHVSFEATEEAGPFMIEYPSFPEVFEVGQEITVEWDIANTDGPLVNCQKVNVYLSSDAGFTWKQNILAFDVDNDGSETVTIPNQVSEFVRIIVAANDNIFYDMSNLNCEIVEPSTPGYFVDVFPKMQSVCLPSTVNFTVESAAFAGYSDPVNYEIISGLPAGAVANFSNNSIDPNEDVTLELDMTNVTESGEFVITIEATSGTIIQTQEVTVTTQGTNLSTLDIVSPAANEAGVTSLPTLTWVDVTDASRYDLQLSSSPAFTVENIILDIQGIANNAYALTDLLEKNSLYYWRVRAHNDCIEGEWLETKVFGTETLNCSIGEASNLTLNISSSGTPTVIATIPVTSMGEVVSVSVEQIQGVHDRVSDLAGILESQAGTQVILWEEKCSNSSNFNLGFDNDAATNVECPINTGQKFKPDGDLDVFAGEGAEGIWKLILEDRDPGNGGTFQIARLQICSNAALDPPVLVNNELLELPPNVGDVITSDHLLAQDPDNSAAELIYTIVRNTTEGILSRNNVDLLIGETFTQNDINSGSVRYRHNAASSATSDRFSFTISDGNGGWVGNTIFDIAMDESFSSDVKDIDKSTALTIYPNPTKNQFTIEWLDTQISNYSVEIFTVEGKRVFSSSLNSTKSQIDISGLTSALYIVEIKNGQDRYQKRILKID